MLIGQQHYKFEQIRGELIHNEPLSKHTTWKVGGAAEIYFKPKDRQDLQSFLTTLSGEQEILWLGLGSNILFPDNGFRGIVINAVGQFKKINIEEQDKQFCKVQAEVGVTCSKFAREMANNGLLGAEFFSGIPGSIGGALAMNAGAFSGESWASVQSVETINLDGTISTRTPKEFDISYRHVNGLKKNKDKQLEWFISAEFIFEKNIKQVNETKKQIRNLLTKRNQTQPTQQANAGSVFKNPKGDFAARLIEQCGLKNKMIGDACVSKKHANFIINQGNASANDIKQLIQLVANEVHEKTGIQLETEVIIIEQDHNDNHINTIKEV